MKTQLNYAKIFMETVILTVAVAIIAAAVYFFLVPSHTSVSSISGLGIVLSNFIPLPLSAITMILNVVLLVIGFLTCGREFGAKTVYTSILLPAFIGLFERLFPNIGSLTDTGRAVLYPCRQRGIEHPVQPQRLVGRAGHRRQDHEQIPAHGPGQGHVAVRHVCGALRRAGLRQKDRGFKRAGHLF